MPETSLNFSKESRPGGPGVDIIPEGGLYRSILNGIMECYWLIPYHAVWGEGIS